MYGPQKRSPTLLTPLDVETVLQTKMRYWDNYWSILIILSNKMWAKSLIKAVSIKGFDFCLNFVKILKNRIILKFCSVFSELYQSFLTMLSRY